MSTLSSTSKHLSPEALAVTIKLAQDKRINESRDFFEQLITDYPTCGRFWKIYIEQELKARQYDRAEKLFQRCLIKVLNVDLWKCYLNYIKETKSKMTSFREKMAQAYDFALEKIGLDVASYNVWHDYVNFLKSVEAIGSFAESQKITAVRKVYQKGVMNPMINVEQFWKDYCTFENQINPLIAKKMIDDRSREFMTVVRRVSKEYENMTKQLDRVAPAMPPQGASDELRQINLWKRYIEWEKGNPLKYEDQTLVAKRVMFAYEQCLLSLSYHPDIWYDAANYLHQMSTTLAEKGNVALSKQFADEASNLYERAINSFMKNNMLIYFAYADFEEGRLNYPKVKQIYDKVLENKDIDPTLCYIQHMRFSRRAEGIRSARTVFKRAREDERTTYHAYAAAAYMEYYCSKDQTNRTTLKIFQLGAKKFGHIPEYMLAYLEYMSHLNEDETTRALFETILSYEQLPKEKSFDIWLEYLKFESNVGTLSTVMSVIEKRQKIYEELNLHDGRETALTIDAYKYLDLLPCNQIELKSMGYYDLSLIQQLLQSSNLPLNVALQLINQQLTSSALSSSSSTATTTSTSSTTENQHDELMNTSQSANDLKSIYPVPDVSQLQAFKAVRNANAPQQQQAQTVTQPTQPLIPPLLSPQSMNTQPSFAFPTLIIDLIKRLPPPYCYDGPFVMIEEFMQHFLMLNLPNEFESIFINFEPQSKQQQQQQQQQQNSPSRTQENGTRKRSLDNSDDESNGSKSNNNNNNHDDDLMGKRKPALDIFKQRQQQKQLKMLYN